MIGIFKRWLQWMTNYGGHCEYYAKYSLMHKASCFDNVQCISNYFKCFLLLLLFFSLLAKKLYPPEGLFTRNLMK